MKVDCQEGSRRSIAEAADPPEPSNSNFASTIGGAKLFWQGEGVESLLPFHFLIPRLTEGEMTGMKIAEFLSEKAIVPSIKAVNKEGVIRELVDAIAKAEGIRNKEELVKALIGRELLGSTGIGQGVGIPHAKTNAVKKLVAAFGICHPGAEFEALDGEPVYIFFLLVAPEDSAGPHLKALARISRLLKDKFFRESLKQLTDEKAILKLILDEDAKKP